MEKEINLWASPMSYTPWSSSSVHHFIYYPPRIQGAAFTDNISPREEIWLSGISKKTYFTGYPEKVNDYKYNINIFIPATKSKIVNRPGSNDPPSKY